MRTALITGLLTIACVAPAMEHGTSPGISGEDQRRIGLAELPQPVRDTILREAAGAAIGDVTRDVEDGRVIYDVLLDEEGLDRRIRLDAEGRLVPDHDRSSETLETSEAADGAWEATKETSQEAWQSTKEVTSDAWDRSRQALDDDGLTLDNVPAAVKSTIEREAGGREILDIDVDAQQGELFYRAEVRVPDASNQVVRVGQDGSLRAPE